MDRHHGTCPDGSRLTKCLYFLTGKRYESGGSTWYSGNPLGPSINENMTSGSLPLESNAHSVQGIQRADHSSSVVSIGAAEDAADIVIIHTHPLFIKALQDVLVQVTPTPQIHVFNSVAAAYAGCRYKIRPIVCLDASLDDGGGTNWIMKVRCQWPEACVIALVDQEIDAQRNPYINAGATKVIPKDAPIRRFIEDFQQLVDHRTDQSINRPRFEPSTYSPFESALTPRQREVLDLIAQGLCNKRIARRLNIAEATTKAHIYAIFRTLAVANRTQAVLRAKTTGVLSMKLW